MKKYASTLLKMLNKEHGTSFVLKDFRSFSRFMDVKTRNTFKQSPGFAISAEQTIGLILTHPYNQSIGGLVNTQLHEYHHLIKDDNCTEAQKFAEINTSRYTILLKDRYQ